MRLLPATKIALGLAALAAVAWFGWNAYVDARLARLSFEPVKPGAVNLVALDLGRGYKIVVANRLASLRRGAAAAFGAPGSDGGDEDASKPISIRDLLGAMQGDAERLARLVMSLNDITDDQIPDDAPVWPAERIESALAGDGAERARLIQDLNVTLEGEPLDQVHMRALNNGIVLDIPVTVQVGAGVGPVVARVRTAYMPRFLDAVSRHMREKFDVTREAIIGYYREEARLLADGKANREDVAASLRGRIEQGRRDRLAEQAQHLVSSARILINEAHVTGASASSELTTAGKDVHRLMLSLDEEGRDRLWKFSRRRKGFQLLVVVDGIALAAPTITHELSRRSVTITNMPDKVLVDDAVARIGELVNRGSKE